MTTINKQYKLDSLTQELDLIRSEMLTYGLTPLQLRNMSLQADKLAMKRDLLLDEINLEEKDKKKVKKMIIKSQLIEMMISIIGLLVTIILMKVLVMN